MKTYSSSIALRVFAFTSFFSFMLSCNSKSDKRKFNADSSVTSTISEIRVIIPYSIVQFLITSASNDFRDHQPPLATDFLTGKVGNLISSANEKSFISCGEFLSQENGERGGWETFAKVKTSGFEQYVRDQALSFCQEATVVLAVETSLSVELKNNMAE
jgi:hypothetical protein